MHSTPQHKSSASAQTDHQSAQRKGAYLADHRGLNVPAQLKAKVNINDDSSLEKEADVMGAKALQRKESSPQTLRTGIPRGDTVQGYFLADAPGGILLMAQEKQQTQEGSSFLQGGKANISVSRKGALRVSDDGQMAIENGGGSRQAKMFYASANVLQAANAKLKSISSPIRLASHPGITVKNRSKKITLLLAYPLDLKAKKIGDEVCVPQRCNETAPYIANTNNPGQLSPKYKQGHGYQLPTDRLSLYSDVRLAAMLPLLMEKNKGLFRLFFESMLPWWKNVFPELNLLESGSFPQFRQYLHKTGGGNGPEDDQHIGVGRDLIGERYIKEFIKKKGSKSILEQIGINEYIEPEEGDILSIRHVSSEHPGHLGLLDHQSGQHIQPKFPYHFATVIARSGKDYITMENYARLGEEGKDSGDSQNDPRYFFQMYGPLEQSFHSENKADYANAITIAYSGNHRQEDYGPDLDHGAVKKAVSEYNEKLSRIL